MHWNLLRMLPANSGSCLEVTIMASCAQAGADMALTPTATCVARLLQDLTADVLQVCWTGFGVTYNTAIMPCEGWARSQRLVMSTRTLQTLLDMAAGSGFLGLHVQVCANPQVNQARHMTLTPCTPRCTLLAGWLAGFET
jgi:hypothetical protein